MKTVTLRAALNRGSNRRTAPYHRNARGAG
jgi:hypothetical protein